MKEAIVWSRPNDKVEVDIHDVPVPAPGPSQVLIKVVVTGMNPKDWKVPVWFEAANGKNSGDDIAGVVSKVGDEVTHFRPGDRVAAFHEMMTPSGSFAEYAIAEEHCTFSLPKETSFEEGATLPLAAMTAAIGLFSRLGVPEPWNNGKEDRKAVEGGVLVYGGASAVGGYVLKLLAKADVHPVYVVAGKGKDFVEGLIDRSKGDTIVDYREGDEALVKNLKIAMDGRKLRHAFDAVSEKGSDENIVKVLEADGRITTVLPGKEHKVIPATVEHTFTNVGDTHGPLKEMSAAWFRLVSLGLKEGWFSGHPHEVIPGGLGGVQEGLERLREGKASAVKYVFRIGETAGVQAE
ncbi:zinc-binding alcohol dehydrogenase family protein [Candidatus Bathyarchaeota archaeon]|nr:zinc-binding alcohol dehydrogenase family protein [Candidatus Bathyarchaeota archaeon]